MTTTASSIRILIRLNNEGVDYLASGALDKATDSLCQALAQAKELLSLRESFTRSVRQDREEAGITPDGDHHEDEQSSSCAISCRNKWPNSVIDVDSELPPHSRELVEVKIDFHRRSSIGHSRRWHDSNNCDTFESTSLSSIPTATPELTSPVVSDPFIFESAYKLEGCCQDARFRPSPPNITSAIVDGRIQIIFTCIVFNLALTHHLWAIVEARGSSKSAISMFSYRQCKSPSEYLQSATKLYELAFSLLMQDNTGTPF
jgi:hypothetical protein